MQPESKGGWNLDGVWSDDFHHEMRHALTGDSDGYFQDFDGSPQSIAATARQGWFYTGQHSSYFGKPRGTEPLGLDASRFVFCLQNHDQIGNRAFGDRMHAALDLASWRAASVLLLMLPETPLLFMGQEWAASTPFLYFTDHHAELGRQVTEGRRKEFGRFAAFADPRKRESIPDPQREDTFRSSKLRWEERTDEPHASMERLYQRLLAIRKTLIAPDGATDISALSEGALLLRREASDGAELRILVRLCGAGRDSLAEAGYRVVLTTEDADFAPDAQPPVIEGEPPAVRFKRPGAVVFQKREG
jgi:maltooligosyltrehalose trehalohydrolase